MEKARLMADLFKMKKTGEKDFRDCGEGDQTHNEQRLKMWEWGGRTPGEANQKVGGESGVLAKSGKRQGSENKWGKKWRLRKFNSLTKCHTSK